MCPKHPHHITVDDGVIMFSIPRVMSNDESKLVASIIVNERKIAVAQAEITAAIARLNRSE